MDQHSRILERARRGKPPSGLPDSPPKFGVAHLLLWTACCAAYLAIVRAMAVDEPGFVGFLILLLLAMIEGASWAGLAIFISRRFRGVRWRIEPGEWLLAIFGARLLLEVLLRTALSRVFDNHLAILGGATSCLLIVPALSRHMSPAWRVCFCALAAVYAIPVVSACLRIWLHVPIPNFAVAGAAPRSIILPMLPLVVLFIFVMIDFRNLVARGWLHFVGAAVCLAILIARVLLSTA